MDFIVEEKGSWGGKDGGFRVFFCNWFILFLRIVMD